MGIIKFKKTQNKWVHIYSRALVCWTLLSALCLCMDSISGPDDSHRGCVQLGTIVPVCHKVGFTPAKQSEKMIGNIVVGLVVVNGPYPYNISSAEADQWKIDIKNGLEFYLSPNEPLANIKFTVELYYRTITVVPVDNGDKWDYEKQWRDPVMQSINKKTDAEAVIEFTKSLMTTNVNAAYVAFINKFPIIPSGWPWAYAIGEYYYPAGTIHDFRNRLVMSINPNPVAHTVEQVKRTMCHETCHIFGACDEYQPNNCSLSGINNVRNCNNLGGCIEPECSTATKPQVPCLMANQYYPNPWNICQYTRGQIGWPWWKSSQPLNSLTVRGIGIANIDPTGWNKMYMAYQTIGQQQGDGIQVSSSGDGYNWTDSRLIREYQAQASIGCAWLKDKFYMSWYGTASFNGATHTGIVVASPSTYYDIHSSWSAFVLTSWSTQKGFGLASLNDTLYMAYLGDNGKIYVAKSSNPLTDSWSDNGGINPYGGWTINQGIGFTNHNNNLYFAYCTTNNAIFLGRMLNGDINQWHQSLISCNWVYNNMLLATSRIGLTSYTDIKTNKSYLYMAYGAADTTTSSNGAVMVGYMEQDDNNNNYSLWNIARINSVENIFNVYGVGYNPAIGLAVRYNTLFMAYVKNSGIVNLCYQENKLQAGSLPKLSLGTPAKL
jgi:hypothetical protein